MSQLGLSRLTVSMGSSEMGMGSRDRRNEMDRFSEMVNEIADAVAARLATLAGPLPGAGPEPEGPIEPELAQALAGPIEPELAQALEEAQAVLLEQQAALDTVRAERDALRALLPGVTDLVAGVESALEQFFRLGAVSDGQRALYPVRSELLARLRKVQQTAGELREQMRAK